MGDIRETKPDLDENDHLMDTEREHVITQEDRDWIDEWVRSGLDPDGRKIAKAVRILGPDGGAQYVDGLRKQRPDIAIPLGDALVKDADQFADEWSADHDGETYRTYSNHLVAAITHVIDHGEEKARRMPLVAHLPNITAAYVVRGYIERDEGRHKEALRLFERAEGFSPYESGVLIEIADTLMDLGRFDEAIEAAELAAEVSWKMGEVARARRIVGHCEGELGHLALAGANFVVAEDYVQVPDAMREIRWLCDKGWDANMSLAKALMLVPEEIPGIAFSRNVLVGMDIYANFVKEHPKGAFLWVIMAQMSKQRVMALREKRGTLTQDNYLKTVYGKTDLAGYFVS